MSETVEIDPRISELESRLEYLEEANRFTLEALSMVSSLADFQSSIKYRLSPEDILAETRLRLHRLLDFEALAFVSVDEEDQSFKMTDWEPKDAHGILQKELDWLIEDGMFAWSLYQSRSVIVQAGTFPGRLLLHAWQTKSRLRGLFFGALSPNGKPIYDSTLSLISIILLNSANALENFEINQLLIERQRIAQQLEMARAIQESFIPPSLCVRHGHFEFAGHNQTAVTVGGDLYGIIPAASNRYAFFLGDVSGKGIPAGLYMARLFSDILHLIAIDPDPEAVLSALNGVLLQRRERGMFVTLAYGLAIPADNMVRLALAGHPPPLIRKADAEIASFPQPTAPPLGLLPSAVFEAHETVLRAGELILLYSDGIIESVKPSSGEQFGEDRLRKEFARAKGGCAETIKRIASRLARFSGGEAAHDDITFFAVGNRPPSSRPKG